MHKFVLNHYPEIKFGEVKEINIQIQRMNPKRVQREVRREMARMKETTQPSTLAQDYRRGGLEKKRKKRKLLAVPKNKIAQMINLHSSKKKKREASRALLKRYHL
ncbi:hypothetical protein NEOC65_002317 [Neochlamydia sp. AcF65]|nr:hypothetical protein [Neochlamydia sp. AcF65]